MTDHRAADLGRDIPTELLSRYDRPAPRYTSYPTAPEWGELTAADATRVLQQAAAQPRAISAYVHLPFCERMCAFCGCHVVVTRSRKKIAHYVDTVIREIERVRALVGPQTLAQLHLGGGTPTWLTPDELHRVGCAVQDAFPPTAEMEAGIEVDPMVTTPHHLEKARDAGFNRLSLGVQDFRDDVQAAIERYQPDKKSTEIFQLGRALGFESINIDLMYGLPRQTPDHLAHSARRVIELGADRVAVFGYAHVPWMKPHQKKLEKLGVPTTDARWRMFYAARQVLLKAGYQAIGLDHFAKPEDELARAWRARRLNRNFQGYTVLEPTHLLGFGVTAISDVAGSYLQNTKRLTAYQDAIQRGDLACIRGIRLSSEDRLRRHVITEIMCNLRVDFDDTEQRFGIDFREHFADALAALEPLARDQLVIVRSNGLEVTEAGRVFVRNVAMVFDAYLERARPDAAPRFSRTV